MIFTPAYDTMSKACMSTLDMFYSYICCGLSPAAEMMSDVDVLVVVVRVVVGEVLLSRLPNP